MKHACWIGLFSAALAGSMLAQTAVDLAPWRNVDAVLAPGGGAMGVGFDGTNLHFDAGTLPATYQDGQWWQTPDGRGRFTFGPLKSASLDAVAVAGQVLDVPDGAYQWLDLALVAGPGAFGNPLQNLELRYADGSRVTNRFNPVAGWSNSPTAFDHTLLRFTDDSQVQTLVRFRTDFSASETDHIIQQRGNGESGGNRFVDGNGYVLYYIGELGTRTQATLGITVGNNFVVSLAATYSDPDISLTEGYTVVANSMVLYNGFEHRNLQNLKQYEFDVSPFLAQGTGELFVLLTDATPANGWGPYLQEITLFTGQAQHFEGVIEPSLASHGAVVHAAFRTAESAETPYLYENNGAGPSNRGHRFADGTGSITYRFDLPDSVTNAQLTVDLANNFIVSLSGASEVVRYHSMTPGTTEEAGYLLEDGASNLGSDFRFADGSAYMIYQFDLPDDVTTAYAQVQVGNEFVISAASAAVGDFTVLKDWVAETGLQTHDISNLAVYTVDLTPFLDSNPAKQLRLKLTDGVPSDGWGPYLKNIAIVNTTNAGPTVFEPVLRSLDLFGQDVRDEYNKGYYTIDLSPRLANNPKREVLVRFTDGSTGDGWGPGVFWMAVHTGDIDIQSDRRVFDGLRLPSGDPAHFGAGLLHRRYAVDPARILSAVVLPGHPAGEDNQLSLLAATLSAPSAFQPMLGAELAGAGILRLTWPSEAAGFRLQTAASLGSGTPAAWSDVGGAPVATGGVFRFELSATGATRFYRLAR